MSRLKKLCKNKKGFTLVEVVVVLVILAILAAILIPTLTGYVDKAKEKAIISEARSTVLAAQTLASEAYAGGTTIDHTNNADEVAALAEVTESYITSFTVSSAGKVTNLVYNDGTFTATYDGAGFTVTKNT